MTDTYLKSKLPGLIALTEQHNKLLEQHNNSIKALEDNGIPGVRDFFATSALSILANHNVSPLFMSASVLAKRAYELADAMVEERKKTLDK